MTVVATAAGAAAGVGRHVGRGPVLDLPSRPGSMSSRRSCPASRRSRRRRSRVGPGATATLDVTLRLPTYGDTLVVTGSRAPEALRTAPVAVTVLRSAELENTPATNYSDLLRSVPGVNVIELSARDVQIVTRGATGRNARSTLALLDGRSIYQDYFGMVLWDLLPVGLDDVKQVEVARGPGSAIWGANALTGAINIITKSPREMLGHACESGDRRAIDTARPQSATPPNRAGSPTG